MDDIFTQKDKIDASAYGTLGPHYFAARRIVEDAMKSFSADHLSGIAKSVTDEIYASIQSAIEDNIWSDAEINLQNKMWRMVDEIVRGIMGGERWIVDRYLLGSRYDCEAARAAVARHIPDEVAMARIADLENEVKKLKEHIAWISRS